MKIREKEKESEEEIVLTMWGNELDYKGLKTNIIREIRKNKKKGKCAIWMWMKNRKDNILCKAEGLYREQRS